MTRSTIPLHHPILGGAITAIGYVLIYLCTAGTIELPRSPMFDPTAAYAKGARVATNNTCFTARVPVHGGGNSTNSSSLSSGSGSSGGGGGSGVGGVWPNMPSATWAAAECDSSETVIYAVLFAVAWQGSSWLDSAAMASNIKNFQVCTYSISS